MQLIAKKPKTLFECEYCRRKFDSNTVFNDGSLRVWKAYGIRRGKCIRLSEPNTSQVVQVLDLVKCDGEGMPIAHFIKVRSRPQPRTAANSQRCSNTEEEPVGNTSTVSFFSCPEDGCEKTHQRFSFLQHHLVLEKNERALENKTLFDRAVLVYAVRL